jgi:putative transposase
VRCWAEKFGRDFAGQIRYRAPQLGGQWYLDDAVITISGKQHWL